MKREIKFRGKDLRGQWQYGDLIHNDETDLLIRQGCINSFIENETIGQFTGLKDKNGKEIYEGDIMQYNSLLRPEKYYRYVIAWNPIDMAFGCAGLAHAFLDCPDIGGGAQITDSTIIGNIHDNPELLTEK